MTISQDAYKSITFGNLFHVINGISSPDPHWRRSFDAESFTFGRETQLSVWLNHLIDDDGASNGSLRMQVMDYNHLHAADFPFECLLEIIFSDEHAIVTVSDPNSRYLVETVDFSTNVNDMMTKYFRDDNTRTRIGTAMAAFIATVIAEEVNLVEYVAPACVFEATKYPSFEDLYRYCTHAIPRDVDMYQPKGFKGWYLRLDTPDSVTFLTDYTPDKKITPFAQFTFIHDAADKTLWVLPVMFKDGIGDYSITKPIKASTPISPSADWTNKYPEGNIDSIISSVLSDLLVPYSRSIRI